MNEKVTNAMEICAKQVRKVSCVRCRYFEECVRNGGSPASVFGRYLAWLNLKALKSIANEFMQYCVDRLKFEGQSPNNSEFNEGAYAVVIAFDEREPQRPLFRLSLQGDENKDELRTLLFNAYIRAKKKATKGKRSKKNEQRKTNNGK